MRSYNFLCNFFRTEFSMNRNVMLWRLIAATRGQMKHYVYRAEVGEHCDQRTGVDEDSPGGAGDVLM